MAPPALYVQDPGNAPEEFASETERILKVFKDQLGNVPTKDPLELPDTGIVTTFCIVNVPFLGQRITPPYVSAYVLLDGSDIAFLHLILGVEASEVRMGMRVKAVWKPEGERSYSMETISHFEPTGEPDADYESYRRHL